MCVYFLKLLKCEKYINEKVCQISLLHTTYLGDLLFAFTLKFHIMGMEKRLQCDLGFPTAGTWLGVNRYFQKRNDNEMPHMLQWLRKCISILIQFDANVLSKEKKNEALKKENYCKSKLLFTVLIRKFLLRNSKVFYLLWRIF